MFAGLCGQNDVKLYSPSLPLVKEALPVFTKNNLGLVKNQALHFTLICLCVRAKEAEYW